MCDFIYDVFSVIQNIADSRPKVRYLLAKDDSQNSLSNIVKVRIKFIIWKVYQQCKNLEKPFNNYKHVIYIAHNHAYEGACSQDNT